MTPSPAVDVHAHFYPEAYLRLIEREGGPFGAGVSWASPEGPVIEIGGRRIGPLRPAFIDLDRRRREMDRQRVGVHALSLTLPMVYWADGPFGLRLARAVNDALVEAHTAFPDRFVGLASQPGAPPRRFRLGSSRRSASPPPLPAGRV